MTSLRPALRLAVPGLLALLGGVALAGCDSENDPVPPFTVVIPKDTLEAFQKAMVGIEPITALVDRRPCVSVDPGDTSRDYSPAGDVIIVLGGRGQPAYCHREGAMVIFISRLPDGDCIEYAVETVFRSGGVEAWTNLSPKPPVDPRPATPQALPGQVYCRNSRPG
jgi:hypothetical protein